MNHASIQRIVSVRAHPNADLLDIATVLCYECIVKRDQWKAGELCVFIEPDSVLPEAPWSAFYRAKGNRVKAIRLRNCWSFGIVESFSNVGYTGPVEECLDLSTVLGVTHYESPVPQDLAASGPYGFGIPRTDETRYQSISELPFGEKVDVTLKVDGQSWSAFCKLEPESNDSTFELVQSFKVTRGVGGRSFLYKLDCDNNYTRNERQYDVLNRLEAFCRTHEMSICLRGESYGGGIQKGAHNPHSKLPLGLALFSTWLIDERRYACKGDQLYIHTIASAMGLPTVPVLERDVILTPEVIKRYAEIREAVVVNGVAQPFEGVVINHSKGSFKVISLGYDARH